jgi:hypothetical protein
MYSNPPLIQNKVINTKLLGFNYLCFISTNQLIPSIKAGLSYH